MNDRLKALYKSHILTKSKDDSHFGDLPDYTHVIEAYNAMCGDKYSVYLIIQDDRVVDARFKGFGCAISKASTAVFTERLKGSSFSEIEELVALFLEILDPESSQDINALSSDDELIAFAGTRNYPERLQCASLAWDEWKEFEP